jgi:hypothetical protein
MEAAVPGALYPHSHSPERYEHGPKWPGNYRKPSSPTLQFQQISLIRSDSL